MRPPSSRGSTLTLTLTLAATSCASADPNARPATENVVIVSSDPGGRVADVAIARRDHVGSFNVPFDRDDVWELLPAAYQAVGLPAPALYGGSHAVEVQNHAVTRRLGEVRLSDLLDCGSDVGGRFADTHRIRMTVRTWLEHAGGANTIVRTRVDATASAQDRPGTITCTSNGALEQRIADAVVQRARG